MEEINEIKIPKGVDRIAVKQHDDRIVFEFIPEEPKEGDLAIFWNNGDGDDATIRLYDKKGHECYYDSYGIGWENAIKFESKEQFEKVLRGEI